MAPLALASNPPDVPEVLAEEERYEEEADALRDDVVEAARDEAARPDDAELFADVDEEADVAEEADLEAREDAETLRLVGAGRLLSEELDFAMCYTVDVMFRCCVLTS